MKNPIFLLFAAVVAIVVSCERDETSKTNTSILPIEKGNSWTYKTTSYNAGKTNIDTISQHIGDLVTINGVSGYQILEENDPENVKHSVFLAKNDEQGNLVLVGGYSDVDTLLQSSIIMKRNVKKGDVWHAKNIEGDYSTGAFSINEQTYTCINADTTVVTPKGSFKSIALSYSPNNGEDRFIIYLSPGIGEVYTKHYEGSKLFSSSILIDYKLN